MKKVFSFILLLTLSLFLVDVLVKANQQEVETINVSVTTYFDDDNIIPSSVEAIYGNKVSFDNGLATNEDYTFVTWLLNDTVKYGYAIDHEFTVTKTMDLKAIFKPADQFAVLFMDANGKFLGVKFVTNGGNVEDDFTNLPTKPGYIVSENRWNGSLENITSDKVLMLQYEPVDAEKTFTLTVVNGTSSGSEYVYNTIATVVADAPIEGQYFSHWEVNGKVVSYQETYSFTMLKDTTITAVYSDETVEEEPYVTLSDNLELRDGYFSHVGQFYLPEGYELIEYGMLTINDVDEELNIKTHGVTRHQGNKYDSRTNEWLMSFNKSSLITVRAFLVVKDISNETLKTYYSDAVLEQLYSEVELYQTGFEGPSKTGYARDNVILNGIAWVFDNALLGKDSSDRKTGSQSARINKLGFIQLLSPFALSKIEFKYAKYGSDLNSSLKIFISTSDNDESWIEISEIVVDDITLKKQTVDLAYYRGLHNILDDTPLYLKIMNPNNSSGNYRVNIDDLVLFGYIKSHYVIFEENGGRAVDNSIVGDGLLVSKPANPTKEGYVFDGWYQDKELTIPFDFNTPITKHIKLYAKWTEEEILTIQEVRSLSNDSIVTTKGIVTMKIGNNAYIQDSTGGLYVYTNNDSTFAAKLEVGNEVKVSGIKTLYGQAVQINEIIEIEVLKTNQSLPTPIEFTDLSQNNFFSLEGRLVNISNLSIVSIPNIGTSSYSVNVTNGSFTFEIRVDSSIASYSQVKTLFQNAVVGQQLDLVNVVVNRYNNTPQVMISLTDQIQLKDLSLEHLEELLLEKIQIDNVVTSNLYLLTNTTIAGKSYTIEWISNNEDIISNTGVVNRPEAGKDDVIVTLTANVLFDGEFVTSLEFDITVPAKENTGGVEYTETFDNATVTGSYGDGSFVGENGVIWTYVHARNEDTYPINGKGILLRRSDEPSSLTGKFLNGMKSFSFEYRKAYTGNSTRNYKVDIIVDGNKIGEYIIDTSKFGSGTDDKVFRFELNDLNLTGVVEIKIYAFGATGNQQMVIDNFSWIE